MTWDHKELKLEVENKVTEVTVERLQYAGIARAPTRVITGSLNTALVTRRPSLLELGPVIVTDSRALRALFELPERLGLEDALADNTVRLSRSEEEGDSLAGDV